ncbi:MAG: GNAT family N-acetyltransferase [Kiritimatiellaeota bacterium]|nr:GNAT family N-acetyltransferase [Kiritimatiellota bacterium]
MTVIEADSSHIAYLSDFGRKSFIYAYQCTLPLEELNQYIDHAFSESTIREEINGLSATYFVCQNSALNPCGYAKLIQSPPPECIDSPSCIELQRLYVDSDYRGHGVGRLLEMHSEAYAKNRNIRDIWLRVWDGNTVAQDIYKKWEFTMVGEELYPVGKDQRTVLLMRKSLSDR